MIFIFGGDLVDNEETEKNTYREMSFYPVTDTQLLASTTETVDEYLNHSCDPNCWLIDAVTAVARRNLKPGDEITIDSATWDCDENWTYTETGKCTCNSRNCRKILSPNDWQIPELQKRYRGHFSPYIQQKIDKMNAR